MKYLAFKFFVAVFFISSVGFGSDSPAKQEALKIKMWVQQVIQITSYPNFDSELCYIIGFNGALAGLEVSLVKGSNDNKIMDVATHYSDSSTRIAGYCGLPNALNSVSKGDFDGLKSELSTLVAYLDSVP